MLRLLRLVLFLIGFSLINITVHAQVKDLGNPISWKNKLEITSVPSISLPQVDLTRTLQEDAINDVTKNAPWRFGYTHNTNLNLNNSGVWETLPNGDKVWRLQINSRNAISMNVILDNFQLAPGAVLHMYDVNRTELQGAYTSANNNDAKTLGTMPIQAESIILELYEPQGNIASEFTISKVIHGYRSIFNYASETYKELNESGKCNYDVKCPLGDGWENQINAVGIIVINGAGACTGTLINNTLQDATPYFLTANHCTSGSNVSNWVFRFNWDSPTPVCAQNANSAAPAVGTYPIVNGSSMVATRTNSDFALLRLNSTPSGDIYYAGWNRSETAPTGTVTGIHHPAGDVKKISIENNPITAVTYQNKITWRVANWDRGTTEGGSSGSALFDSNKRIIGQLYGGDARCSGLSNTGSDYYGRLGVSWDAGTTANTRLKEWLDPNNSGVTVLDGYNPNTPTADYDVVLRAINNIEYRYCDQDSVAATLSIRNQGLQALTSLSITYGIQGESSFTYNWTGNLASTETATITLPKVAVVNGTNTFFAEMAIPNQTDNNTANNNLTLAFNVVNGGESVRVNMLTDCYGSEITWVIRNASNTVLGSGGPYTDTATPTVDVTDLCLPVGCYTFVVTDSYGDGMGASGMCNRSGNFSIVSAIGDTLVRMTTATFGRSATYNFCVTTPTAPVAAFTAAQTTICQGSNVIFSSQSTGATQYNWEFVGGTPSTSTVTNPSIAYNTPGTYPVKLKVTNSLGADSLIRTDYITVAPNNMQLNIATNNNTLTVDVTNGTAPYTYFWNTAGRTNEITVTYTGNYSVTVTDANGCRSNTGIYHTLVGVDNIGLVEFDARIYPNPTNSKATLELANILSEELVISLINIAGQRLTVETVNTSIGATIQKDFDVANLPSGIYMIQVATSNGAQTFKLVKQ